MRRSASLSTRVDEATKKKLDEIARQRRQETGDAVNVSDLLREAVSEYVEKR